MYRYFYFVGHSTKNKKLPDLVVQDNNGGRNNVEEYGEFSKKLRTYRPHSGLPSSREIIYVIVTVRPQKAKSKLKARAH